jgi:hypothetical protein
MTLSSSSSWTVRQFPETRSEAPHMYPRLWWTNPLPETKDMQKGATAEECGTAGSSTWPRSPALTHSAKLEVPNSSAS